jgi:hypothetical protein
LDRRGSHYRFVMFVTRVFSGLTGLALLASRIACLVVIAWFVVFAVNQSKAAANHQLRELAGTSLAGAPRHLQGQGSKAQSGATKTLDEVTKVVVAPFAGLTAGRSPWVRHGLDMLLVLLVYGFGVGFLVRLIRVST